MAGILVPSLQILPQAKMQKLRELPVQGAVLVAVGQAVQASDIVARAELPGDLHILRAAEQLGIEAFEVLNGIKVEEGQPVTAGQVLCEHAGLFGLFRTRCLAPEDGTIEFIAKNVGHIGLRLPPRQIEVDAYVAGTVIEVTAGKSALIEATGALVQAIFGIGGEQRGIMRLLSAGLGERITESMIPADCKGAVLLGGMCPSLGAVRRAAELGAVGMVVGSLDDQMLRDYLGYEIGIAITGDEEVPLTLIATEGFGSISLSQRVWDILSAHAGLEVSINGATQVRAGAVRPEILVPLRGLNREDSEIKELTLEVGCTIRIIRYPYFGERGEVLALPHEPQRLETGALARVLSARLLDGREVVVPRANVEILA